MLLDILFYVSLAGGILMAFSLGANDAANSMASAVGAKAITMRQAIFIAGVCNFVGAAFLGAAVTTTVAKGIIDPAVITDPTQIAVGMLSALLASGLFVLAATLWGLPVSSSHAIVGGIAGFGILVAGWGVVDWTVMAVIIAGWVATPFIAGLIAFLLSWTIRWSIMSSRDVGARIHEILPIWMALVACIVTMFLIEDVFIHTEFSQIELGLLLVIVSLIVYILGFRMLTDRRYVKGMAPEEATQEAFRRLQVFTSGYISLAHGANDVANAFGPVLAIYLLAKQGVIPADAAVPVWVLVIGGAGIATGIAVVGRRVIATVGDGITRLDNVRGFSADFTIASTVMGASMMGLPVSSSHAAVGAITGTGFSQGKGALNLKILGRIFAGWIVTVPVSALVSIGLYLLLTFLISL